MATTIEIASRYNRASRLPMQVLSALVGITESDAEFDARFEAYFSRPDIDGWEIRKGFSDLAGLDLVPEPTIVAAALRACRRVNDHALSTRILEVTRMKSLHNKEIWPYMVQVSALFI